MNWRRAMNEALSFISNGYTRARYPDAYLAQAQYSLELGRAHIDATERLDDLDAERRATFTEQWKSDERLRIQREANAVVTREIYPARQVEVHEPYLQSLRELADDDNLRYLLNPDYQAARFAMETKISQRRDEVERQFSDLELELNSRFGFAEHETQPPGAELVEAFLTNVQDQQSRQHQEEHDLER